MRHTVAGISGSLAYDARTAGKPESRSLVPMKGTPLTPPCGVRDKRDDNRGALRGRGCEPAVQAYCFAGVSAPNPSRWPLPLPGTPVAWRAMP